MSNQDTSLPEQHTHHLVGREQPLSELSLKTLRDYGTREMRKYHHGEQSDDRYSLEIFRRAVVLQNSDAWAALQALFSEHVRSWFVRHAYRQTALRYEPVEQTYIDDTFRRFWQAVSDQRLMFSSLAGAIRYLHMCLNCAIMDVLRAYARPREESLPDDGSPGEPLVEDAYHEEELWEIMKGLFYDKREKRLAYLLFQCNLKPREIMRYCPGEFSGETEIYRIKRNIMDRLLRHSDRIRWRLDGITGK
ncbi:MAG TPA: hypothetical protein VH593_34255 [Ktedonobacteraceae bacterium]